MKMKHQTKHPFCSPPPTSHILPPTSHSPSPTSSPPHPIPHPPHPTPHTLHPPGRHAFTLVELLIVLLLMGIVYALAFNYIMPKSDKEAAADLTLKTLPSLFRSDTLYGKKELMLYCKEEGKCLLAIEGKIERDDIRLRSSGIAYIVTPDETLQSIEYPHIKIENREFKPRFSIRCRADGLFDPQIVRVGERWFYIHPFGKVYDFSDPVTMISFIRQSDYLPDRAGYAQ